MADNLTLQTTVATPPSGSVFATDDVAGVHYPIGKLAYGASDSASLVTATQGFPVAPIVGQTGVTGGAGTVDAATQRVAIATDANVVDTELPAAVVLADATANPTVPGVGAFSIVWNGSTWDRAPGNTLGSFVCGHIAHDAPDAGFPIKIGGHGYTSMPSGVSANNDRVDACFDDRGKLGVFITAAFGSSTLGVVSGYGSNDALSGTNGTIVVSPYNLLYNGASSGICWDRQRNNYEVTALSSSARTASVNSSDITSYNARGVVVTVDCTANASAAGITVVLKYKDTLSGKYVAMLTSATLFAASATGTVSLVVCPGVTVAANLAVSHPLPRVWRVEVTNGDGSSITYSVGANYIT